MPEWPQLDIINASSHALRAVLEWGPLRPLNNSAVGERWALMISTRNHDNSARFVRRVFLHGASTHPFLVALPTLGGADAALLELRACLVCHKCSGDESISSAWRPMARCRLSESRFYNTSGVCTRARTFYVSKGATRRPASALRNGPSVGSPDARGGEQSQRYRYDGASGRPSCGARQLSATRLHGSWSADGGEFFHHGNCELLSTAALSSELRRAEGLRILFVGDSTLEEVALLVAHASGYAFDQLDVRPCGNASRYRHFDAAGRAVEVSMRWAAHPDCRFSFGAASLPFDPRWSAMVRTTASRLRPHVIVFNAAAGHHLRACETARWGEQKAAACARERVAPRLLAYLRFVAGVARTSGALPVFLAGAFTTDFKCNVDLARFHALCLQLLEEDAALRAARVLSLDLFAPSYSWLSTVTSEQQAGALNGTCWTSGHCSCLGKARAFLAHAVSPPCWLEARALAAVVLEAFSAVRVSQKSLLGASVHDAGQDPLAHAS